MQASSNFTKAIHICIFLNIKEGDLKSSVQIAESVDTNPVVIRRLIGMLRTAGITGSMAGSKGGFYLVKPANKISLWDIYLAVREEKFFQRPKVNPDCDISCNLEALVKDVFTDAELSMKSELDSISIDDLSNHLEEILEEQSAQIGA